MKLSRTIDFYTWKSCFLWVENTCHLAHSHYTYTTNQSIKFWTADKLQAVHLHPADTILTMLNPNLWTTTTKTKGAPI